MAEDEVLDIVEKTDDDGDGNKSGRTIISLVNGDNIRVAGNWFDEISKTFAESKSDYTFIVISAKNYKRKIFIKHIVSYFYTTSNFRTIGEEVKNVSFSSTNGF